MTKRCALILPGQVDYNQGLVMQENAWNLVREGLWDGILLLLEHPPVVTIGRSGGSENLQGDAAMFASAGIVVANSSRGGNVTCHNPGQIVGYPVLNLSQWQEDVHWYVERVEEVIIRTLAHFGLRSGRKARYTGVWLDDAKIAAIGIAVKHWVTSHGFALNVDNDLALFDKIIPCGIRDFWVTSLSVAGKSVSVATVMDILLGEFAAVFACELVKQDWQQMLSNGRKEIGK